MVQAMRDGTHAPNATGHTNYKVNALATNLGFSVTGNNRLLKK